ncbi:rhomboid family intramembrane serine protease [Nakamurella flava]|nr:rhomboid family intramembrane serine protease [Nakamurella flava]
MTSSPGFPPADSYGSTPGSYSAGPPGGFSAPVVPTGSTAPAKKPGLLPENLRAAAITVGVLALAMVVIQIVNWAMGGRLATSWGIEPRSLSDLWSILTAPLVHYNWQHLLANIVPLIILGVLISVGGMKQFVAVTVLVWLLSGLGVWLISPSNSVTVGASGVVFGWLAFLIARGVFTRSWKHILLGIVLLAVWGSLFWTGIVRPAAADLTSVVTISWQAHLCGALAGVLAAFLVSGADRARRKAIAV